MRGQQFDHRDMQRLHDAGALRDRRGGAPVARELPGRGRRAADLRRLALHH